ncbi:unnamed protein product [Danaus chrysippus]|uniref:(African queen) hypothetical protein n=1 Tax=Danaus chrysippus TaxID=151541 RepID=A0A8J2QMY7_9NEOP|nr:unnamed protein product [Danaus chrysippus]
MLRVCGQPHVPLSGLQVEVQAQVGLSINQRISWLSNGCYQRFLLLRKVVPSYPHTNVPSDIEISLVGSNYESKFEVIPPKMDLEEVNDGKRPVASRRQPQP